MPDIAQQQQGAQGRTATRFETAGDDDTNAVKDIALAGPLTAGATSSQQANGNASTLPAPPSGNEPALRRAASGATLAP